MSNKDLYSNIASLYDIGLWLNGYKGAANHIASKLPFHATDSFKVLDAGCGTGLYSIAILKKFPKSQVVAFDLNEKMVEKMKKNLERYGLEKRATVFVGDVLKNISNEERDFDLIVTGGVLEYVDIRRAVKNLTRYIQKDGYFLNSPVRDNWLVNVLAILFRFKPHTAQENIITFTQNGFELQKTIKIPFRYFPICFVKTAHLFKKHQL